MNKNKLILLFIIVVLIAGGFYFSGLKKSSNNSSNTSTSTPNTPTKPTTGVSYKNTEYRFSISLPKSWDGYTVIEDEWDGFILDSNGKQVVNQHGPLISIRHPDWEYKAPRQDIPIMVFTIAQWNSMLKDEFHIGVAPINPSEIGRNSKYVFAIPARYNFSYLTGYEEVDQIIKGNNFKTF